MQSYPPTYVYLCDMGKFVDGSPSCRLREEDVYVLGTCACLTNDCDTMIEALKIRDTVDLRSIFVVLAARSGSWTVLEHLLSLGDVCFDTTDFNNHTALDYIVEHRCIYYLALLVNKYNVKLLRPDMPMDYIEFALNPNILLMNDLYLIIGKSSEWRHLFDMERFFQKLVELVQLEGPVSLLQCLVYYDYDINQKTTITY